MDDIERAEAHEQMFRDIAIAQVKPVLKPCNFCFYCGEKVASGRLFCDGGECAADWENEQRIRQIIGNTKGHC